MERVVGLSKDNERSTILTLQPVPGRRAFRDTALALGLDLDEHWSFDCELVRDDVVLERVQVTGWVHYPRPMRGRRQEWVIDGLQLLGSGLYIRLAPP